MNKKVLLNPIVLLFVTSMVTVLFTVGVEAKLTKNTFNGMGKVLVQGAPIHGANGIMFDGNDQLYIASVVGREIVVMDPRSGRILKRLGTDVGVEGPDDLAFGPDGSLYWTSLMTGEVGRLSPDGTVKTQFVAVGVNPVTFNDDGRLFVALDFLGDGLYELDPNLTGPPTQIAGPPLTPFLGFLNGMDFGPDGLLYGPIWTQGSVVRIDVDDFAYPMETVADGFGTPAAVKFDSQGNLYVADQMLGEVSRVDVETGDKEVIATGLSGLDNLAFDSHDRLYVSHAGDGSIYQILPSGKTRTVSKGGMIAPGGVAVMPHPNSGESVFVADLFTLREFNGLTGKPISVERHDLTVPGDITSPMTVSADGDNLILSSWFANEVQVWNPETGTMVADYPDFAVPLNAIGFQGDIAVAELMTGRVVRASDNSTIASGLYVPAGLATTEDDLWVSDWASGIVWQIVTDGSPTMIPVAMGLSNPEGLAVDLDGSLLVVESGAGRLSRIDHETGIVSTLVEGLELGVVGIPGYPPTWGFNGVAVGSTGYIYVTGDVADVLYRFKPTH
jgi:sugar lactone lactonase YvrE